jgi:hypothetical protein
VTVGLDFGAPRRLINKNRAGLIMRVERLSWLLPDCGELSKLKQAEPDLIIYFGSRTSLASGAAYEQLNAACPGAMVLGCTTGGQIHEHDAVDDEIAGIAIRFDQPKFAS